MRTSPERTSVIVTRRRMRGIVSAKISRTNSRTSKNHSRARSILPRTAPAAPTPGKLRKRTSRSRGSVSRSSPFPSFTRRSGGQTLSSAAGLAPTMTQPMTGARHLCHMSDLTVADCDRILDRAEKLVPVARGERKFDAAQGKILATLFFEPSTRTRLSFETAMLRLGGACISVAEPGSTSSTKGETLQDTVRMVASYSDAIVLRHPREGSARAASRVSRVPIINGGDGAGQHPTQTLTDLFTIRKAKGTIVMHPLPRVDEIHASVDDTPAAKYFEQAANGVPVRMALLSETLGVSL